MAAQKMNLHARQSTARPVPDEISLETMARNGGSHLNRHQVRAVVEREKQRFVLAQKGAKGLHQQTTRAGAKAMDLILAILDGEAVSLPVEGDVEAAVEELKRDVA
jgi:hypothetical protein